MTSWSPLMEKGLASIIDGDKRRRLRWAPPSALAATLGSPRRGTAPPLRRTASTGGAAKAIDLDARARTPRATAAWSTSPRPPRLAKGGAEARAAKGRRPGGCRHRADDRGPKGAGPRRALRAGRACDRSGRERRGRAAP